MGIAVELNNSNMVDLRVSFSMRYPSNLQMAVNVRRTNFFCLTTVFSGNRSPLILFGIVFTMLPSLSQFCATFNHRSGYPYKTINNMGVNWAGLPDYSRKTCHFRFSVMTFRTLWAPQSFTTGSTVFVDGPLVQMSIGVYVFIIPLRFPKHLTARLCQIPSFHYFKYYVQI